MNDLLLIAADARRMPLADSSVQCIVTSPPYWGLRKYAGEQELIWGAHIECVPGDGARSAAAPRPLEKCLHEWGGQIPLRGKTNLDTFFDKETGVPKKSPESIAASIPEGHGNHCQRCGAWRGAYGLEPTIEMYIAHTVEILRECRRVLRSDGVLFWNIGDSYCSGAFSARSYENLDTTAARDEKYGAVARMPANWRNDANKIPRNGRPEGLKPKDLCLIPARMALAAQADGWWVRSLIIWAKPNPMPESATDRPTDAYEHIIMLTKSARYFWDADAVREPSTSEYTAARAVDVEAYSPGRDERNGKERFCSGTGGYVPAGGRNMRNVWTFPTQPYSGAHFATFPEEIPRRAILAATSARGACAQCAAPWERVTRREIPPKEFRTQHHGPDDGMVMGWGSTGERYGSGQKMQDWLDAHPANTVGFRPTCRCRGQRGRTAPCVVLDPFGGSGTTGRVALELARRGVLLDLAYKHEYAPLAAERTKNVQTTLSW